MKEVLIYGISACASLVVLGYSIHMFIGGMVSERTEQIAIVVAVLIGAVGLAFLTWDILRRRHGQQ